MSVRYITTTVDRSELSGLKVFPGAARHKQNRTRLVDCLRDVDLAAGHAVEFLVAQFDQLGLILCCLLVHDRLQCCAAVARFPVIFVRELSHGLDCAT
jgi:hypothetical protein